MASWYPDRREQVQLNFDNELHERAIGHEIWCSDGTRCCTSYEEQDEVNFEDEEVS